MDASIHTSMDMNKVSIIYYHVCGSDADWLFYLLFTSCSCFGKKAAFTIFILFRMNVQQLIWNMCNAEDEQHMLARINASMTAFSIIAS